MLPACGRPFEEQSGGTLPSAGGRSITARDRTTYNWCSSTSTSTTLAFRSLSRNRYPVRQSSPDAPRSGLECLEQQSLTCAFICELVILSGPRFFLAFLPVGAARTFCGSGMAELAPRCSDSQLGTAYCANPPISRHSPFFKSSTTSSFSLIRTSSHSETKAIISGLFYASLSGSNSH